MNKKRFRLPYKEDTMFMKSLDSTFYRICICFDEFIHSVLEITFLNEQQQLIRNPLDQDRFPACKLRLPMI